MNSPLKNSFVACLGLCITALPLPAQDLVFKGDSTTASLLELYSSEGCSSCPPAEAWLNRQKSAPGLWKDLFPVAFHVDYWDGLGWPDRFARPAYTQRQQDYAARLGQDSVYTPEFIANGREWHRGGLGGQDLPSAGAEKTGELSVTVSEQGGKLAAVYLPPPSARPGPLLLNVALLGFDLFTDVQRGENEGRKLQHDFVVLSFQATPLAMRTDNRFQSDPVELKSTTTDLPGAVVAWVSTQDGSILQVAGGWLAPATPPRR